jgi:membrane associated rhomboid family serine protease/Flp pilus assembly protein TadD
MKLLSKDHSATILLVVLNTVFYGLMVAKSPEFTLASQTSQTLIDWGGNFGPLTLGPEPGRLLTCTFLHANLPHLLVNLCLIVYVGSEMERTIGTAKYLLVYLVSGIVGSLVSVEFQPWNVSVGASGAIFGIFGLAFSSVGGVSFEEVVKTIKRRAIVLAVMLTVVILPGFFIPGMDNSAHLGGFFAGLILGFAMIALPERQYRKFVIAGFATVTLGPLIAYILIAGQYFTDPRMKSQPFYIHGEQALSSKKYDVALEDFDKALVAVGDNDRYKKEKSAILKGRTGALIQLKRYDDALEVLATNQEITDEKDRGPLLATTALVKQRQEKYQEAIDLYKQALEKEPDNAGIRNDMAWAQAALGDLDDGLKNVNIALKKNDKQTSALDTRGTIYLLQKNYDAATKDLDRALSLNPKEGAAYFHKAGVHLQKGEQEECEKNLKAAKELKYDPDSWEPKTFPELVSRLNKIGS